MADTPVSAISGYFPKREKTPRKLSAAQSARVQAALAVAAERGLTAAETRLYVIDRMTFDFPACPFCFFSSLLPAA